MGCGQVSWLGLGGGRIVNFMDRTRRYLSGRSTPHTLVVHIGSNDIFAMTKRELCEAVDKLLSKVQFLHGDEINVMTKMSTNELNPCGYTGR